jgi:hypothetical protein
MAGQASISPAKSGHASQLTKKPCVNVESPNGKTVILVSSTIKNNKDLRGPTSRN